MKTIISANNLTKKFDHLLAVNHITFNIQQRECFGFLGPNGAGKTTTMRMIQGVSPKTSGTLKVNGLEIEQNLRKVKKILGVVPQENNLDPDFTVLKNLLVYARYFDISRSEAKSRALKLLKFVQLEDKKDIIIEKLSGGMKRRLILARALINEPEVLIMDEPTTGLDPQARHMIWNKIMSLKKEGVTVVLTTHYMDEAAQLCDRLVIMDLGKIIVEGNPDELVQKYIGSDIVETDNNPEVLMCLMQDKRKFEEFGDRIHVFTNNPKHLTTKLMQSCQLTKVTIRQASLEDVFLKLTGKILKD